MRPSIKVPKIAAAFLQQENVIAPHNNISQYTLTFHFLIITIKLIEIRVELFYSVLF